MVTCWKEWEKVGFGETHAGRESSGNPFPPSIEACIHRIEYQKPDNAYIPASPRHTSLSLSCNAGAYGQLTTQLIWIAIYCSLWLTCMLSNLSSFLARIASFWGWGGSGSSWWHGWRAYCKTLATHCPVGEARLSGTEDAPATDPLPGLQTRGVVFRIRIWSRVRGWNCGVSSSWWDFSVVHILLFAHT
jgi:hypothetical protein